MKQIIACLVCICCLLHYDANSQILEKLKNKAKQRADQKVDQTIDKGLDEVEGKNKTAKSGESTDNSQTNTTNNNKEEKVSGSDVKTPALKSYSRYDFIPGDKIVYAEDFSQDVIGEFPLKWNTDGTGEIVTIEGLPGQWLKMTAGTKYESPFSSKLPENYTVEFDLVLGFKQSMGVPHMNLLVYNKAKTYNPPGIDLYLGPQSGTYGSQGEQNTIDRIRLNTYNGEGKMHLEGKDQLIGEFYKYNQKAVPVHVALWVQKERVRVWINNLKVYDLPKGLPADLVLTDIAMHMGPYNSDAANYQYYLSNLKIAVATPDTRNKLLTTGKWSTTGILFDINSDRIKPTSFGVLKETAAVIKESNGARFKIIGHTDSDGDDKSNLDLSKRRAAAVKVALVKEFEIEESRLDADGAGETSPLGDNKTPEGKAQNRRVEFVKL
jgi:OOP family OmpA-OmpF porin